MSPAAAEEYRKLISAGFQKAMEWALLQPNSKIVRAALASQIHGAINIAVVMGAPRCIGRIKILIATVRREGRDHLDVRTASEEPEVLEAWRLIFPEHSPRMDAEVRQ